MVITEYRIKANIPKALSIAVIADLHDRPWHMISDAFKKKAPDIIVIPGDLVTKSIISSKNAIDFLRFAAETAPTFYSLGNHETLFKSADTAEVTKTGVTLLDNCFTEIYGITVGGLTTGYRNNPKSSPIPNIGWIDAFSQASGFKLLLSHHPEYYFKYLKAKNIDVIVSGHAHGGQIRLFGRGLYAPGQGILPKYTSGIHDQRLIISRGLANTGSPIPRLFNPTELVYIHLLPQ